MTSQILKFLLIATLTSCSVGPDYKKESIASPATYKAVGLSSAPPVGNWWSSFSDPTLTSLLTKAQQANPQALAALARLDQARAILGLKGADRLPTLTTESLGVRQQDTRRDIFELPPSPYNKYRSALNLNWELDLWGRVRRSVAQQKALTQATAADYVAALLSTKAEVARDYLALRHLDSEISLLSHTIKLREENQKLLQVRLDAGTTTPIDSARARSQTETARAELYRLKKRRAELENALAVLTGSNPSTFKISSSSPPRTPTIPAGVPADLLRRRPDVAATERRLAVAAEERGIVIAKYLPKVSLTASGGFAALSTSDLFDSKSRLWAIGPNATFAPLTFGSKKNEITRAHAAYREALENHRQSVLSAFRDVENALSGINNLDRALAAQAKSASAAREAARLIKLRYQTGLVSFFEVIDANREHLNEQRAHVQTRAARQQATVQLIQALGGSWK